MTESMVPQPEDPYGISKYAIELDLLAAHQMFGLNYVIFRPHNVYGERQNIADKYRNVIGIFMNQVLQGKPMTVFGDGLQTRAFSHIDDVAPVIARAPTMPGALNQVFNIGADTPHTIIELTHEIAEAFGVAANLQYLPPRQEVQHAFSDHKKLMKLISPASFIPLKAGLKRMAQWVTTNGPAPPTQFANVEIEKNLPPSWRP
jgi:UDP-glucose 4-epimerase